MASIFGARSSKEPRRVLDEATRQRRARKALESLESDNFHDDPHADLVRQKTHYVLLSNRVINQIKISGDV